MLMALLIPYMLLVLWAYILDRFGTEGGTGKSPTDEGRARVAWGVELVADMRDKLRDAGAQ
jgi:hypothetical protein